MIDLKSIRSLSDFQRNTKEHVRRLKKSGKPEVLTINGEAALIVQSAEAYQELLDAADVGESVRIVRERLRSANKGEKGIPADEVLRDIRKKLGLTRQR